jgi:hypothetical protein
LQIFGHKQATSQRAVAEFQVMFGRLHGIEKKKLVIEWMKQQGPVDPRHWMFPLPFSIIDSSVETTDKCTEEGESITDLESTRICKNALLEVIGQSKTWSVPSTQNKTPFRDTTSSRVNPPIDGILKRSSSQTRRSRWHLGSW